MSQLNHYISQLTLNIKAPTLNNGDELMHVRAGVWALLTFPTVGIPLFSVVVQQKSTKEDDMR